MKTLSLLRHAKSSWDDPALEDFDRPLNKRGIHDAPLMAAYLRDNARPPQQIVSSPALRAITTANIMAAELGMDDKAIIEEPAIYDAGVNDLIDVGRQLNDSMDHIMMVGHNPGLSILAGILTGKSYDMPTCAVLNLKLDIDTWSNLIPGVGSQVAYYRPKDISE